MQGLLVWEANGEQHGCSCFIEICSSAEGLEGARMPLLLLAAETDAAHGGRRCCSAVMASDAQLDRLHFTVSAQCGNVVNTCVFLNARSPPPPARSPQVCVNVCVLLVWVLTF